MNADKVKATLGQYRSLVARLSYLDEVIYTCENKNISTSDKILYDRAKSEYKDVINQMYKINMLIDRVDNPLYKTLLEKYYIQGEKIDAIAYDTTYSNRWVYKSIKKAIEQIAEKENCDF